MLIFKRNGVKYYNIFLNLLSLTNWAARYCFYELRSPRFKWSHLQLKILVQEFQVDTYPTWDVFTIWSKDEIFITRSIKFLIKRGLLLLFENWQTTPPTSSIWQYRHSSCLPCLLKRLNILTKGPRYILRVKSLRNTPLMKSQIPLKNLLKRFSWVKFPNLIDMYFPRVSHYYVIKGEIKLILK